MNETPTACLGCNAVLPDAWGNEHCPACYAKIRKAQKAAAVPMPSTEDWPAEGRGDAPDYWTGDAIITRHFKACGIPEPAQAEKRAWLDWKHRVLREARRERHLYPDPKKAPWHSASAKRLRCITKPQRWKPIPPGPDPDVDYRELFRE